MSGCVEQQAASYQTPSGRPEVLFAGMEVNQASERLVGLCADKGILVQQVTPNQVTCGGTMTGGDAALAQMVIGNSYSTTPSQYVQFTMFPYQGGTRVQAQQWVETQMAFGQVNRAELNSGNQFNAILQGLMSVGAQPFGTPNPQPTAPGGGQQRVERSIVASESQTALVENHESRVRKLDRACPMAEQLIYK